jgi:hypothetical protein
MSLSETIPAPIPIYTVRGIPVVIDSDLAAIYEVTTGNFNKAVMRNLARFPDEFSFIPQGKELNDLMFQIGRPSSHGGRRKPPRVFTEHGALMASSILHSDRAIAMSVYVIRAFISMREALITDLTIQKRLATVEKTLMEHDEALWDVYQKLLPLLQPPPDDPKPRIGF